MSDNLWNSFRIPDNESLKIIKKYRNNMETIKLSAKKFNKLKEAFKKHFNIAVDIDNDNQFDLYNSDGIVIFKFIKKETRKENIYTFAINDEANFFGFKLIKARTEDEAKDKLYINICNNIKDYTHLYFKSYRDIKLYCYKLPIINILPCW